MNNMKSLDNRVGGLSKLRGFWSIEKYVLKAEGLPDTYNNRLWYEAATEPRDMPVAEVAKKHFGSGVLKHVRGGDSTPENPAFSVYKTR